MPKYLALAIFISYLIILSSLSLFSFGKISTLGAEYDDKFNHFLAHALLTLLAYNYFRFTGYKNIFLLSVLVSITYGIVIEVLQLTITIDRTFDLLDILANLFGALSAISLLKLKEITKLN